MTEATFTEQDIQEFLPFFANNSLDERESAAVEEALQDDESLRLELAALRNLRDSMQAEEFRSPGEFGLSRLMHDIWLTDDRTAGSDAPEAGDDAAAAAEAAAEAPPVDSVAGHEVSPRSATPDTGIVIEMKRPGRRRLVQISIAAMLALVVGQGVLLYQNGPGSGDLELAGGAIGLLPPDAPYVTIAFVPTATEAQIRALLVDQELEIVAGPSALGLYRVAAMDNNVLMAAREILGTSDIVESIEDGGI